VLCTRRRCSFAFAISRPQWIIITYTPSTGFCCRSCRVCGPAI